MYFMHYLKIGGDLGVEWWSGEPNPKHTYKQKTGKTKSHNLKVIPGIYPFPAGTLQGSVA